MRTLPFSLLAALSIAACSASTNEPDASNASDASTTSDASATSDAATDASSADDASLDASAGDDAGSVDAGSADAGSAGDAGSTGTPDAGGCDYVPVDEVVVRCMGAYSFVNHYANTFPSASCPAFYGVGGDDTRYPASMAAIVGEGCDPNCQWHFSTSVSRIYCGHRDGYETLVAETGSCGTLYRFSDGYYPSVEAHDSEHPCD